MKDLLFTKDLVILFQHDKFYGVPKNLPGVLRKFNLPANESIENIDKMFRSLAVHIMDQAGESEPFLSEAFIYPEAVVQVLREKNLPVPTTLQPASTAKSDGKAPINRDLFEQYFDMVCRNFGTVTDPQATAYRTPIGRLIFKTFLETRLNLGIITTAKYVLEHLKDFDTDKIIKSVDEDSVIWLIDDSKTKLTSINTIEKYILNFNRELKTFL